MRSRDPIDPDVKFASVVFWIFMLVVTGSLAIFVYLSLTGAYKTNVVVLALSVLGMFGGGMMSLLLLAGLAILENPIGKQK